MSLVGVWPKRPELLEVYLSKKESFPERCCDRGRAFPAMVKTEDSLHKAGGGSVSGN